MKLLIMQFSPTSCHFWSVLLISLNFPLVFFCFTNLDAISPLPHVLRISEGLLYSVLSLLWEPQIQHGCASIFRVESSCSFTTLKWRQYIVPICIRQHIVMSLKTVVFSLSLKSLWFSCVVPYLLCFVSFVMY
jgi:hypothetical protein